MENVFLFRERYNAGAYETLGLLFAKGKVFHTLELPWLGNERNKSCIPPGSYDVTFLPRSASGKYKNVWHVHDVENRGGILIHQGNVFWHSRGCILIGGSRGVYSGARAVLKSRMALQRFNTHMNFMPFKLHIGYA